MKFSTTPVAPIQVWVEIETLEPGTLFEDDQGDTGVRLFDSHVILSGSLPTARHRQQDTVFALRHRNKVRALPPGTAFTLTQE